MWLSLWVGCLSRYLWDWWRDTPELQAFRIPRYTPYRSFDRFETGYSNLIATSFELAQIDEKGGVVFEAIRGYRLVTGVELVCEEQSLFTLNAGYFPYDTRGVCADSALEKTSKTSFL